MRGKSGTLALRPLWIQLWGRADSHRRFPPRDPSEGEIRCFLRGVFRSEKRPFLHCHRTLRIRREKIFSQAPQYGKWVFLANNLDWVQSRGDRFTLEKIISEKLRDENAQIDCFLSALGPEGRNILALLDHPDPCQTAEHIQLMPLEIRKMIESLSVAQAIPHLKADLILAHGEEDDLIPFTETLRIARNAPNPDKVHLQILKGFSHVDPAQKAPTLKNIFEYHLPEGWKLFWLVNRLMNYLYPSD